MHPKNERSLVFVRGTEELEILTIALSIIITESTELLDVFPFDLSFDESKKKLFGCRQKIIK